MMSGICREQLLLHTITHENPPQNSRGYWFHFPHGSSGQGPAYISATIAHITLEAKTLYLEHPKTSQSHQSHLRFCDHLLQKSKKEGSDCIFGQIFASISSLLCTIDYGGQSRCKPWQKMYQKWGGWCCTHPHMRTHSGARFLANE